MPPGAGWQRGRGERGLSGKGELTRNEGAWAIRKRAWFNWGRCRI